MLTYGKYVDPFQANVPFLQILKTLKNRYSEGAQKRSIGLAWVKSLNCPNYSTCNNILRYQQRQKRRTF